jgi:hypothetical protein
MYDIKQVKDMLDNGGIAVDPGLEERIRANTLTESDHALISGTMKLKRELERPCMSAKGRKK